MTKVCENCTREFCPKDYRNRFCNRSCAASFNNRKFIKRIKGPASEDCNFCGKRLKTKQYKYCSTKCAGSHKNGKIIQKWWDNPEFGSDCNGNLKASIKKFLLEDADYKCTICKWGEPNPILNRPILTIDHKDGNWKNNSKENLIVLCYNCHTLTPTFGALNKGSVSGRRPNAPNRKAPIV